MPFIPPIIAGVAAASASAGTIATGAAVAGAAVAGVGVGVGIGAGVFTRRDSRGSDNTEGLPVPNLAVVAPAPDWLPCDVPWSYFQKCGAEIATDGYQVETAYVDGGESVSISLTNGVSIYPFGIPKIRTVGPGTMLAASVYRERDEARLG